MGNVEEKEEFIEIHEIWFERIAKSTMPGVMTQHEELKSIAGTNLITSEIGILSAYDELLFLFEVTHDDNIIYGIELKKVDFLNVVRKYELSNDNQSKMSA